MGHFDRLSTRQAIRAPLVELKQQLGHAAWILARRVARMDQQMVSDYLRSSAVPKLQIGAGKNLLPGWLNTDYDPLPGAAYLDATTRYPFDADTFALVYSEHIIEHVPYSAGASMLRECFRVLKPGGVLRISTPDLPFLVDWSRLGVTALAVECITVLGCWAAAWPAGRRRIETDLADVG